MKSFQKIEAAYVTAEPGDATRYCFILAPLASTVFISSVPGRGADMAPVEVDYEDLVVFGQVYGEVLNVDSGYRSVAEEVLVAGPGEVHPITVLVHNVIADTGCNLFTALCALNCAAQWVKSND